MILRLILCAALLHMDSIGRISVPTPTPSGLTFPLVSDFGYGMVRPWPVIVHRFSELATKAEQRFQVGIGPRKFPFKRAALSYQDARFADDSLWNFFEATEGSYQSFTYPAPQADQSFVNYQVIFDTQPLSIDDLSNKCRAGFNFIECPDPSLAPTYPLNATCLRFPSDALKAALLSQVQQIVPLVHIRVRETAVPDIYLSDRRCTVGGQLYLPRLLGLGEPGSDVILSQSIDGSSDDVNFTFGNADRAMAFLSNDTDLKWASIDLSLYHVQSGILLQLWKGYIKTFRSDGSAQFTINASDGLYQVSQQYPNHTISRTCWKPFNDGVTCPWATASGVGDGTACDHTFGLDANGNPIAGANGCSQHQMTPYFGGQPISPQGVNIKDDSTGFLGFGRNTVTATSIISDTIWGDALAEIWCNDLGDPTKTYIANCLIADYRDESTFSDSLGILGAGPIGKFGVNDDPSVPPQGQGGVLVTNADGYTYVLAPMVDGFAPQGFKVDPTTGQGGNSALGLRQIHGADPVQLVNDDQGSITLGQGTPQVWGVPPGSNNQKAAGVAFAEVRIVKAAAIQPSTPDQHVMTVPVSQGLSGWTWDQNGNPTLVPGLTNPFWIAVNSYLRAIGLFTADSATQLGSFVLSSLIVGDGSGTAEIADLVVAPLVGIENETQWRFQGTLGQQKPMRDWLTEILNAGMGYYTFEFGQLKLGIRENAAGVSGFGLGNILFQSLVLEPIEANFEHLIVDFADQDYQYQANTAEYQDLDHAAYYGRAGCPLTARMHSVGGSSLSQMLRMAAIRTREEVGGIEQVEWAAARKATWKTTILALETEAGQVVDMVHPELPGGFDPGSWPVGGPGTWLPNTNSFRIQKWSLNKDWSITIEGKTVTPSMYDLEAGPKPSDVLPKPLPVLFYPPPLGEWAPFQVQADPNDPLWANEWTFDLAQSYQELADGSALARVTTTGKLPVTSFIPNCGAPVIKAGQLSQQPTGGFLPGGVTLRASICATNAQGQLSPPSDVILVPIEAGTDTNFFQLDGVLWPPAPGLTGFVVFVSNVDDLICAQATGAIVGDANNNYTPTTIILEGNNLSGTTGPLLRSTWGLPNENIQKVRINGRRLIHGGIFGAIVNSVSVNQIVSSQTITSPDGLGLDLTSSNPQLFQPITADQDVFIIYWNIPSAPPPNVVLTFDSEEMYTLGGPLSATPVPGLPAGFWTIAVTRAWNGTTAVAHNPKTASTDDWSGRYLIIIGRDNGSAPYCSFAIKVFNPLTGAFTLDRAADALGVQPGDVFVVSFQSYDNSIEGNLFTFSDTGLLNSVNTAEGLSTGEIPHDPNRKGNMLLVIAGTNRGQLAKIVDNDEVSYTLDRPFPIDATSIVIVIAATDEYSADVPVDNADYIQATELTLPVSNFFETPMFVWGTTVDEDADEPSFMDAPVRMLFVYGQPNFLQEVDKVTFGLPTDSVTQGPNGNGANAPGFYGNVHVAGQPFIGSISCVGPPTTQSTILDVLVSKDNGTTWASVLGPSKITYPTTAAGLLDVTQFSSTYTGVVNVAGNAVTWVSGDQFDATMAGKSITINGVEVQIASFTDATHLVTSAAPGDGTDLQYQVGVVTFDVGDLLRIDCLQSGGATGISVVIKWGTAFGTS
jgi:hypothetical protein